jgi:Tol biopolymer transport system component
MLRLVDGMFPAFSADGKRLAFIDGIFAPGRHSLAVMNADGSRYRRIWSGKTDLFGLSWWHAADLLTFSRGGYFRGAKTRIDVAAVRPDGSQLKTLIAEGGNNGWLSFSPDGKRFVFRSGRGGEKNDTPRSSPP